MKVRRNRYVGYVAIMIAMIIGVPVSYFVISYRIMQNGKEFRSVVPLIDETRRGPVLYNVLNLPLHAYKGAMFLAAKPMITVAGSSRSMQVREYFFDDSFYSMSGLGSGSNQIKQLAQTLFAKHRPKVVLVFLDFWDFCGSRQGDTGSIGPTQNGFYEWIMLPLNLAWNRRFAPQNFLRLALGILPVKQGDVTKLGFSAIVSDVGFGADGSYYYWGRMRKWAEQPISVRWNEAFAMMRDNIGVFQRNCSLASNRVAESAAVLENLAQSGSSVVVVLAPMPRNVLDGMKQAGAYGYIDDLRPLLSERFQSSKVEYYDFFDAASFGSEPCEFLDGYHGGEVTYMRLLLKIIERRPDSALAAVLATKHLRQLIATHTGQTTVADDPVGRAYRAGFDFDRAECFRRSANRDHSGNSVQ